MGLDSVTWLYARFIFTMFFSMIGGLVIAAFLGIVAAHSGYNADLVFNIAGPLSTAYIFYLTWMNKM
jgi:hypothetical protein